MLDNYISVDLEMTGLNVKTDRIIEIGAVHMCGGKQLATFQTFINPHRKLEDNIKLITGIEDKDLIEGVEAIDGVQAFITFQQGLPIIGHHIISDYSFLKQEMTNHKLKYNVKAVDTLTVSRKLYHDLQSKSLQFLSKTFNLNQDCGHRALDDAITTARLFEQMKQDIDKADEQLFEPKQLHCKLKKLGPITKVQVEQLNRLISYHEIQVDLEILSLTKSEASRMIDKIIFRYGRIEKDDV